MHFTGNFQKIILLVCVLILSACGGKAQTVPAASATNTPLLFPADTPTPIPSPTNPAIPPTQQPILPPALYGPEVESFPEGLNPLSAQTIKDPSLLKIPALLISISHFPPAARPQAGLSFAPWVFEFYITEGATRFLTVFHGRYPEPENPLIGDCEIRQSLFAKKTLVLGNRVWLDENKNGIQEDYEPGIGGICINLLDHSGKIIDATSTDSNGYYGFNAGPGTYEVEFQIPAGLQFTQADFGSETSDSDADPATGRAAIEMNETNLHLDAGVIPPTGSSSANRLLPELPPAEVGPIRSGRLLYDDIGGFFQSSCLIYAFASPEVLEKIPMCSFVPHTFTDGGAMMPLERLKAIAEDNKNHTPAGFNYAGNLFSEIAPPGGKQADKLDIYVAYLNQSAWEYDAAAGAWQRYVDDAKQETAGKLHREVDRLTGRNLSFENVIIIFADHDVISPTNLDIHLELGGGGFAYLFRDGQQYDIRWSLKAGDFEQKTGRRRPIQFINADGSPAALKPGQTWIFVATPYSALSVDGNSNWNLRYVPPQGAK